jgi:hypothetical protein
MLKQIKRAADDDWRAAAEWLRLTFPNDYRKPSNTSVEVNTAVQMAVVCSEERRQELIKQRERLLAREPQRESGASTSAITPQSRERG